MTDKPSRIPSARWILPAAVLGVPGLLGAALFWAVGGFSEPEEIKVPIFKGDWGDPKPAEPSGALSVVTWNIHFGWGAREDPVGSLSREQVEKNLDGVAVYLKTLHPDFVFLQEVDFDSARTSGVNEMEYLARALDMRWAAPTVTWKKGYLPFPYWPPRAQWGRMLSGQAILSRFPLTEAARLRLPKPANNPFWYNWFNIDRSVTVTKARLGFVEIALFNLHLDAYDTPNRSLQAERMFDYYKAGRSPLNLIAGDFNALPPDASQFKDFPDEPLNDYSNDGTMAVMRVSGLKEAFEGRAESVTEAELYTFPSWDPNRRLDYIWMNPDWPVIDVKIGRDAGPLSDHFPIIAVLGWSEGQNRGDR